jgi:hypothetical protein
MQVIRCGRLERVLRCVVRCTQNHGTEDVEALRGILCFRGKCAGFVSGTRRLQLRRQRVARISSSGASVGRQRCDLQDSFPCKDPDGRCRSINVGLARWWNIAKTFAKLSCSLVGWLWLADAARSVELLRDLPSFTVPAAAGTCSLGFRRHSTICMTVNPPCVWLHRYRSVPIATGDSKIACTVVLLWLQHAKSNNVLRPATERSDPLQRLLLIKSWDNPLRLEQGPL